jgi:hypothetical protein
MQEGMVNGGARNAANGWHAEALLAGLDRHQQHRADGVLRQARAWALGLPMPVASLAQDRDMQAYRGSQEGGGDGMTRRDDPGRLVEQSTGGVADHRRLAVNQTTPV